MRQNLFLVIFIAVLVALLVCKCIDQGASNGEMRWRGSTYTLCMSDQFTLGSSHSLAQLHCEDQIALATPEGDVQWTF